MSESKFKIALAGNPNSGKTSVFNALTGLNHKVGNFPGVTVDKKSATFTINNRKIELTDLPGTYSIYPKSLDELITAEVLANPHHPDYPDGVLIVADATSFKRSLLFTTQILDLGIPAVLALNMMDLAEKSGQILRLDVLKNLLDIPVISINARDNIGITELRKNLFELTHQKATHRQFVPPTSVANAVAIVQEDNKIAEPYQAFQVLATVSQYQFNSKFSKQTILTAENLGDLVQLEAEETVNRYSRIASILKKIETKPANGEHVKKTKKIDSILLHPFWGYITFIGIFLMVFQALFSWSELPMELIESAFGSIGNKIRELMPTGWFTDLLVDGLLAGLSGVLVFIPQIMILFGFLALLEDTGYMARVSFLLDRLMRSVGLGGRSVVSLVSGFACAVPAILAARSISNWKERLITILVTPLMSCSARLPVYTILISITIPNNKIFGFISLQALVLLAFYLLGFVGALIVAKVFDYLISNKTKSVFALELPVYRAPRWRNLAIAMYDKSRTFVFEAGKIIIAVSIILWALTTYGPEKQTILAENAFKTSIDSGLSDALAQEKMDAVMLENSYAGIMGKAIEPVIKPLGFDWKIGIALITSFAAREVFVGTMATIYAAGQDNSDLGALRQKMQTDINPNTGLPLFSLPAALSLMVFYAFAMQCLSTLAVVIKETGGWKWALIQLFYLTILAYFAALLTYIIAQ